MPNECRGYQTMSFGNALLDLCFQPWPLLAEIVMAAKEQHGRGPSQASLTKALINLIILTS